MLRYGSICSGIEAASVAWAPLGFRASFLSEIEAFPRAVLQHHYKDVPLHGDFTTIGAGDYGPIDLLVGGTPCQSFSVAGLRGGLADKRGNLALEYLRLADRKKPRWLLWENVPGVLSSGDGRDFGSFVGGLGELGYGFAYRVLDAQYFGLAQRRKRVFVVGYLGDWRCAAAVLFEPASLRGDSAPSRKARERIAPTISRRPTGGGGLGTDFDLDGGLISHTLSAARGTSCAHAADLETYIPVAYGGNNTAGPIDISTAVNAHGGPHGRLDFESETFVTHSLRADGFDASEDGTGRGTPLVSVSFNWQGGGTQTTLGYDAEAETTGTLASNQTPAIAGSAVRRLTPRECERLQGFPEIKKNVTILVCCTDRQKTSAFAEIQSRRLRPFVSNVADNAWMQRADPAGGHSNIPLLGQEWPVAVNVQIDLERAAVRISSLGRCVWSASSAEAASSSPLSMPLDAFVRLLALTQAGLVPTIQDGEVGSQLSINNSLPLWTGSAYAPASGQEIEGFAKDAERLTVSLTQCTKSITSGVGLSSQNLEQTLETWSCCVAAAISGFIPEQIRNASSYALSIETLAGYTAIPYRNGIAADGPRYKALGNSMAVPVMRWIGHRIAVQHVSVLTAKAA